MITRTILHALWAAIVFVFAVTVALGVLFMLGAAWVGDELRAAAPHDPMLRHGAAPVFGMVLFVGTVTPALTVLPAAIAAIAGEALRIRSWMYYVLAGGGGGGGDPKKNKERGGAQPWPRSLFSPRRGAVSSRPSQPANT